MKANQLLLVVFLLSTLIGCRTKQVPVFIERVVKDSIVSKDSIIPVKVSAMEMVQSVTPKIVVSGNIKTAQSFLTDSIYYSEAIWNGYELYHRFGRYDRTLGITVMWLTHYKTIKEPVPYEVEKIVTVEKELSLWQKTRIRAGEIAMLFVAFFLLRKLKIPKFL